MEGRIHGEYGAIETPIGFIPMYDDLKKLFKDVFNKEFTKEEYDYAFSIRIAKILEGLKEPAPGRPAPGRPGVAATVTPPSGAPPSSAASPLKAVPAPPQQTDEAKSAEFRRLAQLYRRQNPTLTAEQVKAAVLGNMRQTGWTVGP